MSSWSILGKKLHQMRMADYYRTQTRTKFKLVKMHSLKVKETKRQRYLLTPATRRKTI